MPFGYSSDYHPSLQSSFGFAEFCSDFDQVFPSSVRINIAGYVGRQIAFIFNLFDGVFGCGFFSEFKLKGKNGVGSNDDGIYPADCAILFNFDKLPHQF